MANTKSPGSGGLTTEFNKGFWNKIGHLLFDLLIMCIKHGNSRNPETVFQKMVEVNFLKKNFKNNNTSKHC